MLKLMDKKTFTNLHFEIFIYHLRKEYIIQNYFSYFVTKLYVVDAQKNHLKRFFWAKQKFRLTDKKQYTIFKTVLLYLLKV